MSSINKVLLKSMTGPVIEEIKTQLEGEKVLNKSSKDLFSRLLEPAGGMRGSLYGKINGQVGSLFKPLSPLQSQRVINSVLDVLTFAAQTYKVWLSANEQIASTGSNLPLSVLISSVEIKRAFLSALNVLHFKQIISLTGKLLIFGLLTHNGVFNSNKQLASAGRNVSKMESPWSNLPLSVLMSLPAAEIHFAILLLSNQFDEDILIRSFSAHIFGPIQLMFSSIKDNLLVLRGLLDVLNRWVPEPGIRI